MLDSIASKNANSDITKRNGEKTAFDFDLISIGTMEVIQRHDIDRSGGQRQVGLTGDNDAIQRFILITGTTPENFAALLVDRVIEEFFGHLQSEQTGWESDTLAHAG